MYDTIPDDYRQFKGLLTDTPESPPSYSAVIKHELNPSYMATAHLHAHNPSLTHSSVSTTSEYSDIRSVAHIPTPSPTELDSPYDKIHRDISNTSIPNAYDPLPVQPSGYLVPKSINSPPRSAESADVQAGDAVDGQLAEETEGAAVSLPQPKRGCPPSERDDYVVMRSPLS